MKILVLFWRAFFFSTYLSLKNIILVNASDAKDVLFLLVQQLLHGCTLFIVLFKTIFNFFLKKINLNLNFW